MQDKREPHHFYTYTPFSEFRLRSNHRKSRSIVRSLFWQPDFVISEAFLGPWFCIPPYWATISKVWLYQTFIHCLHWLYWKVLFGILQHSYRLGNFLDHTCYLHVPAQILIYIYPKVFRILYHWNRLPTYFKRWLHCSILLNIFQFLPATNN